MKWLAVTLIIIGAGFIAGAWHLRTWSAVDDGSYLMLLMSATAGIICLLIGGVIFAVEHFSAG